MMLLFRDSTTCTTYDLTTHQGPSHRSLTRSEVLELTPIGSAGSSGGQRPPGRSLRAQAGAAPHARHAVAGDAVAGLPRCTLAGAASRRHTVAKTPSTLGSPYTACSRKKHDDQPTNHQDHGYVSEMTSINP